MPNCSYCGKPTGVFRRDHAECRAQFERAIGTIPLFFEKLLESDLPADRFKELLKEVAERFHIEPKKLRSLSVEGVNAMVQSALKQQLMTPAEEDRILEIAEAVGLPLPEMPELEEKLVKIRVLRDLDNERRPDRIEVVGPMPIDLEDDETIIWIMNGARSYRPSKGAKADDMPARPQRDMPDYFSPASLGPQRAPIGALVERGENDLMITDRHLFLISNDRHLKIQFRKVEAFHAYSDGFQIVRAAKENQPLTVTVNDPWFAANLIVTLIRSSSSSGPQLEGAWKTS